jgi:N-acetylmuramic acid 6-phosphate etherase
MVMVRLGKVYRGLMVHMKPTNEKLRRRAERMVTIIAGCDASAAAAALAKSGGRIDLASLLAYGLELDAGEALLQSHEGNLRKALDEIGRA